jgi:hypothetical protein
MGLVVKLKAQEVRSKVVTQLVFVSLLCCFVLVSSVPPAEHVFIALVTRFIRLRGLFNLQQCDLLAQLNCWLPCLLCCAVQTGQPPGWKP